MRKSLEGFLPGVVRKDNYPGLPEELKEYNYWTADCGRCIMAVPECLLAQALAKADLDSYEAAVPVRYVLEKGYRIFQDHVVVNVPYDPNCGVKVGDAYFDEDAADNQADTPPWEVDEPETWEVGQRYPEYATGAEQIRVAMTEQGLMVIVEMPRLTANEVVQMSSKSPLEVRFVELHKIIYFLFRFGSLEWMDAPYSPWAAQDVALKPLERDTLGLAMQLMVFDSQDGELKHIRLVGLGNQFSRELCKAIDGLRASLMSYDTYLQHIKETQAAYPTSELVRMARDRYKLEQ